MENNKILGQFGTVMFEKYAGKQCVGIIFLWLNQYQIRSIYSFIIQPSLPLPNSTLSQPKASSTIFTLMPPCIVAKSIEVTVGSVLLLVVGSTTIAYSWEFSSSYRDSAQQIDKIPKTRPHKSETRAIFLRSKICENKNRQTETAKITANMIPRIAHVSTARRR